MAGEWLSLSQAARLLGVHPGTLRVWSDRGLLPVHRTQGGHRRYRRDEILLWQEAARRSLEPHRLMELALGKVRLHISEAHLQDEGWYQKLDEKGRAQYRLSGRSLMQGLAAYLASEGKDAAAEVLAVGYEYASRARHYGLSYVDAARAFLFFRNALMEAMVKAHDQAHLPLDRAWENMLRRIQQYTDEILISLLETYRALQDLER